MQLLSILITALGSAVAFGSPAPALSQLGDLAAPEGFTIISFSSGYANGNDSSISKRGTPTECVINSRDSYSYTQFIMSAGHTACIAWAGTDCGSGAWSDAE